MPRWLRIVLTGFCFFLFFAGSPLVGIVLPVLRIVAKDRADHRRRCTRLVGRLHRIFWWWMCSSGLVSALPDKAPALPGVAPGRAYVMITNHPSLIDVIYLLGTFRDLTCIVKGSWYRSFWLGPLLRQTAYLPGPGSGQEESEDLLATMVEHLRSGHPLLVFPEGTRSARDRLHRFRRGAVEAAVRARVPLVCAFLDIDRPFLMKGVPFWRVPRDRVRYALEILDVIDTSAIGEQDARSLNAELYARYRVRFQRMLAERAEDRILPPGSGDTDARAAA